MSHPADCAEVDSAGCEVVKRHAIVDRHKVAEVVGALLTPPNPFRGSAPVSRRFAHVFVVNGRWTLPTLVDRAITVARLVGIIVEREVERLGWTPERAG